MAALKKLVQTNDLKIDLIRDGATAGQLQPSIFYDDLFDAFRVFFVSPERETVVHYVDGDIALIVYADTLEIVGLHVEDFRQSFVPSHDAVESVWKLSGAGVQIRDLGDVIVTSNKLAARIVFEIVKATEAVLGEPGTELAAILS